MVVLVCQTICLARCLVGHLDSNVMRLPACHWRIRFQVLIKFLRVVPQAAVSALGLSKPCLVLYLSPFVPSQVSFWRLFSGPVSALLQDAHGHSSLPACWKAQTFRRHFFGKHTSVQRTLRTEPVQWLPDTIRVSATSPEGVVKDRASASVCNRLP
jgi:hypothetical protein